MTLLNCCFKCGADPNASTIIDAHDTSLMLAIKTDNERAVELLLAYGADTARKIIVGGKMLQALRS